MSRAVRENYLHTDNFTITWGHWMKKRLIFWCVWSFEFLYRFWGKLLPNTSCLFLYQKGYRGRDARMKVTNFRTHRSLFRGKSCSHQISDTVKNCPFCEKSDFLVKVTAGKKVWSCGKCATCMAEDCGKCIYCLDRPKFGGPFIKKQRCIKRRCLNKVKNKSNGTA